MVVFAIIEPRFLSSINLFNVMRQVSITGLLAIGMTFVILTAGIDLSVGSLLAFAGLVGAAVAKGGMQDRFTVGDDAIGYGWPLAALAAIARRPGRRLPPGLAITRLKVPPFVVTLGGMSVFRGAALLFAAGGPISGFQPDFTWWGQGKHLLRAGAGHHLPGLRRCLAHIVLRYTRYGRQRLCGGRQSRSGAPRRPQCQPDHLQRLRHHGLLCRPRRLRAVRPAQFGRGRGRHRL